MVTGATVALGLGVLLYLGDRPPGHAMALPAAWSTGGAPRFGAAGDWLPSFLHPFAFSLLWAALRPPGRRAGYGGCVGWAALNLAFEFAQHEALRPAVTAATQAVFGQTWPTRMLGAYLGRGVFDPADVAAVAAGALAAAAWLAIAQPREIGDERHPGCPEARR